MEQRKPISCIILNYNDAETTKSLVRGISGYEIFHAIVVVDNMSTDDSFAALSQLKSDKVHVISSGFNGGYGYGNNAGIRYIQKHFDDDCFIIANPDVVFSEYTVEQLVDFMRARGDCGIVTGVQNGDRVTSVWKEVGVLGDQLFNSIVLNAIFHPRYYSDSYLQERICNVYAVSGCFFLARMKAFAEIGMYDEDFFLFEEEKCTAEKLKAAGWSSYLLTNLDFRHEHSVSIKKSIKKLGQAKAVVLKSNRLYLKKYKHVNSCVFPFIYLYHGLCFLEQAVWDFVKPRIMKHR